MLQNKVSYEYYLNNYCMGQAPRLTEEQFGVCEKQARTYLRGICTKEVSENNQDDILACVCAISEEMYLQKEKNGIKTESIDGYSVTFKDGKAAKAELLSIANIYLGYLGVLYAGVE